MDRLIVNAGTDSAWEAPVTSGRMILGSAPDCDVVLAHESVAAQHAELEVSPGRVLVRDLGGEQGTWCQGARITEMEVQPGMVLLVGRVAVRFEAEEPVAQVAAPPVPVAPPVSAQARGCRFHPRSVARWHCPRCQRDFCELCVSVHGGGQHSNHFCRNCASECYPLAVPVGGMDGAPGASTDFWELLPGALVYPFKGNGPILLIAGAIVWPLLRLLLGGMGYGLFRGMGLGFLLGGSLAGYTFSYCKSIIEATANGEDALPDWPDLTDVIDDVLMPFLQLLALQLLSFGPMLILLLVAAPFPAVAGALMGIFFLTGITLAPMGMLALAIFDRIAALNPALLVPSILRCPLQYAVAAASFLLAIMAYSAVDLLFTLFPVIPFVNSMVAFAVGLYFLVVSMRVLGVFYRANSDRLGWMNRR